MRTRLNSSDRRTSIVNAAKSVFARYGFEGAKTQQIAAAAEVSEALLYRHFPSKTALYRAVLRATIEDQDRSIAHIGKPQPGARGIVAMLVSLFYSSVLGVDSPNADGVRMMFASLAGDGTFARLVYRRAVKRTVQSTDTAIRKAISDGEALETGISSAELIDLIAHVGLMTHALRMAEKRGPGATDTDQDFVRKAVWFCGRGMGLTETALATHYPAVMMQMAGTPTPPPAPAPKTRKPRKKADKA